MKFSDRYGTQKKKNEGPSVDSLGLATEICLLILERTKKNICQCLLASRLMNYLLDNSFLHNVVEYNLLQLLYMCINCLVIKKLKFAKESVMLSVYIGPEAK